MAPNSIYNSFIFPYGNHTSRYWVPTNIPKAGDFCGSIFMAQRDPWSQEVFQQLKSWLQVIPKICWEHQDGCSGVAKPRLALEAGRTPQNRMDLCFSPYLIPGM